MIARVISGEIRGIWIRIRVIPSRGSWTDTKRSDRFSMVLTIRRFEWTVRSGRGQATWSRPNVVLGALDADPRGIQRGAGRFFVPCPLDSLHDVNEREERLPISLSLSLSLVLVLLLPICFPLRPARACAAIDSSLFPQEHGTTAIWLSLRNAARKSSCERRTSPRWGGHALALSSELLLLWTNFYSTFLKNLFFVWKEYKTEKDCDASCLLYFLKECRIFYSEDSSSSCSRQIFIPFFWKIYSSYEESIKQKNIVTRRACYIFRRK